MRTETEQSLPAVFLGTFQDIVRAVIDVDKAYDAGVTGEAANQFLPTLLAKVKEATPPRLLAFADHPQVKQLIIARLSFPKWQRGS